MAVVAERRRDLTGKRLDRIRRAERDLLRCVEEQGEQVLGEEDRRLLALERDLAPDGAVARVAPAIAVLHVLQTWLTDARYAGVDPVDGRLRKRVAWSMSLRLMEDLDPEARAEAKAVALEAWRAAQRALNEASREEFRARSPALAAAVEAAIARALADRPAGGTAA